MSHQDDIRHGKALVYSCFQVGVDNIAGGHVIPQSIVPRVQQVPQVRAHKECPVIPSKVRSLGYLYSTSLLSGQWQLQQLDLKRVVVCSSANKEIVHPFIQRLYLTSTCGYCPDQMSCRHNCSGSLTAAMHLQCEHAPSHAGTSIDAPAHRPERSAHWAAQPPQHPRQQTPPAAGCSGQAHKAAASIGWPAMQMTSVVAVRCVSPDTSR